MRAGAAAGKEDDGLTMGTICKEEADEGEAANVWGGWANPRECAERRKMLRLRYNAIRAQDQYYSGNN